MQVSLRHAPIKNLISVSHKMSLVTRRDEVFFLQKSNQLVATQWEKIWKNSANRYRGHCTKTFPSSMVAYCSFWNEICMGFLKWHLFTDFNPLFKMKHPDPCYKGPDHLESTILKITGKISVVIYSLLFFDNWLLCRKIVNFLLVISTNNRQFSNITSFYLKITSCRWLKENNRLLFSVTGIAEILPVIFKILSQF